MENGVVLLSLWSSPYVMRVKIALAEKKVEYECHEEDLQNKSSLLLQMNPVHKRVPVLIHKGNPICESLIAVQYIDETWPNTSPFLPSDPYARSEAYFWADFVENKICDSAKKLLFTKGEEQEVARSEFIECVEKMEGFLGEKPYFGGEMFGFVDIAFIPFYCWFYSFERYGGFKMEEKCPKIVAWSMRCMEKESVFKALPDPEKIYDYVQGLMKK